MPTQRTTKSTGTPASGGLIPPAALRAWQGVAALVARVGGPDCEAVLHDLADPMHSVVFVVNGSVTGRRPGQGFRHLVAEMLRVRAGTPENGDLLPDWWFIHREEGREKTIRSMTLLIRDDAGQLAGALCVNIDVTADARAFERMRGILPGLCAVRLPEAGPDGTWPGDAAARVGDPSPDASPAGFAPPEVRESVPEAVFRLIDRMTAEALEGARRAEGRSAALSREERRRLVAFMEERGIFLVKGAIERTAERLGVSRVTVYSDLDGIRKNAAGGISGRPDGQIP